MMRTDRKQPVALKKEGKIAVFDSGVGGISVLRELRQLMPGEDYLYFGDSKRAPYGTKEPEALRRLCEENTKMLLRRGAKCMVIACNTATSAAAGYLRERYDFLPIIGMEPAVKPAAGNAAHQRVLVLATPITIHGSRLHRLVANYADETEFVLLEAPDIVRFVEAGICDAHPTEALRAYFRGLLAPFQTEETRVDSIVLGCTHFPFVKRSIQEALPYPVAVFDGARGTAMQTRRRLEACGLLSEKVAGEVTLLNSEEEKLPLMRSLLELPEL